MYGDVPNRAIAYIIDVDHPVRDQRHHRRASRHRRTERDVDPERDGASATCVDYNPVVGVIQALIYTAISAVLLHLPLDDAARARSASACSASRSATPRTAPRSRRTQGIKRWIALGAPFGIAQALNPLPGLGILIGLAAFVWFIALLYTTATSPTKQGIHDKYAGTIVAKAARTVA